VDVKMTIFKKKASGKVLSMTGNVHLRVKSSLSLVNLQSAAFFARESLKCENAKGITENLKLNHRAYVIGAIVLSVSFLESTVNELFLQAVHKNNNFFSHLAPNVPNLLCELWEQSSRLPILDKYQKILTTCGKKEFEKGRAPYQDVDSVIRLRNSLVHYKPEWDDEENEHKKLESRLKSKFPPNPFAGKSQAFFPHKCLGHGCTEWAIQNSIKFVEAFYQRLGVSHPQELSKIETR